MHKTGAILLSIWSGFQGLMALAIVVSMALLRRHAPSVAVFLGPSAERTLDPRVLGLIDATAILLNAIVVGLCVLLLAITWTSLRAGARWARVAMGASLGLVQLAGFLSDGYLGGHYLWANLASTAVVGLGLAATYLHRGEHAYPAA
jgi:hypothetical protein